MFAAAQSVRHVELHQVVTRKDGTVEDLGVTSYYHRRRLCRVLFRIEYAARRLRCWIQSRS